MTSSAHLSGVQPAVLMLQCPGDDCPGDDCTGYVSLPDPDRYQRKGRRGRQEDIGAGRGGGEGEGEERAAEEEREKDVGEKQQKKTPQR